MAREYMERQAYMEIENAARSCPQFDQQIVSMSQTQVHSPSPEALPPNATMLPGTSLSHVDGCSGVMKRSASAPGNSANGMVAPQQTNNENTYQDRQNNNNNGNYNMINSVRKKLSNNFEHYSNMLQEMALPMLLGRKKGNNIRSREASRDRAREAEKPKGHSMVSDSTHSEEDDFEFVENIELHHLDGFIFSSGREQGKGHDFQMVQLKAPTWCDKCGDFIWGVYKQCLVCKSDDQGSGASQSATRDARPKSFLREEVDEFDRIFSELLYSAPVKPRDPSPEMRRTPERISSPQAGKPRSPLSAIDELPGYSASPRHKAVQSTRSDTSVLRNSDPPQSACAASATQSRLWDDNDRLFAQLLDDLDNISGNTPSVRRRKKARDIFSNWLFNSDSRGTSKSDKVVRRRRKSSEITEEESVSRRHSTDFSELERKQEAFSRWHPKSFEYTNEEDDADSGYHTANSTLLSKTAQASKAQAKVIAPSQGTLTREDLRRRIEAFNNNSHGLIMTLDQNSSTFQGFIRVHMNLIRPINMSLAARPPSIYEVLTHEEPSGQTEESQIASFYLPKDTTKVIHINSDTTAQEVIRALLTKFRITDNPRKFALYEKIEQTGEKATMRRLGDLEPPLHLCLGWTASGLAHKKFVLQENEPGEIMWEAFSMPELENFLKILDREEAEYVEQIKAKYILFRIQLERRRKELGKEREEKQEPQQSKREPVYV